MHIIICDGSRREQEDCRAIVEQFAKEHKIRLRLEIFSSGEELLFKVEDNYTEVDVIIMDTELPDLRGIEVAARLRKMGYIGDLVIYASTLEYALEGYDVNALSYILKDKSARERIIRAMERAAEKKSERDQDTMIFSCGGDTRCILVEDIRYFEIQKRVVTVHYGDRDEFSFYSSMKQLEEDLDGKGFLRTHKSYLVKQSMISRMTARQIILSNGEALQAGQSYTAAIRKAGKFREQSM